ncbi:MAG: PilN domain-containing protein [Burkholderiales bacterium]|nr:PilN domain-containing protein [Burkholderiales bacterium]
MIRINLLPHREARRKASRRQLAMMAVMVAIVGIAVAALVHGVIAGYLAAQNDRNEFLKRENAKLDKDIAEIKKLKDEIAALLARKQIIETLQNDRARAVNLLDTLVRQTPDGVYLKTLKQTGLRVKVTGYAQSNARVSAFMRNLQSSDVLQNTATSPQLIEIKATTVNGKRLSEFDLDFSMKPPTPVVEDKKPRPAAPAKKG